MRISGRDWVDFIFVRDECTLKGASDCDQQWRSYECKTYLNGQDGTREIGLRIMILGHYLPLELHNEDTLCKGKGHGVVGGNHEVLSQRAFRQPLLPLSVKFW